MVYTNSPLAVYRSISPHSSPRTHAIDTVTIHCMAGNLTIEACGTLFSSSSRIASSNYGVGSDGRIALYVEEKDRSMCSSDSVNDNRAVTIEVANDGGAPDWHVSDKAMHSLIELLTDICRRNHIEGLRWEADRSLIGNTDRQNMTVHRWFAPKACPGNYLYDRHSYIAEEVSRKLGTSPAQTPEPATPPLQKKLYRVRRSWSDSRSQTGAFSSLKNAKAACPDGYTVFDSSGNAVYSRASAQTAPPVPESAGTAYGIFVRELQAATGAVADGFAGAGTLSKTVTLSKIRNSRHPAVKAVQKYLNSIGYDCGSPDGIAGPKFERAIKAFQRANGCIADGEITAGMNTWKKLLKLS